MKDKKRRRTKREIQKITRTLSAVAVAVVLANILGTGVDIIASCDFPCVK